MAAIARKEGPMRPTQTDKTATEIAGSGTHKRPCREDTMLIGAYFKTPVSFAWRALVAELSIERRSRVTGQDALAEAMLDYFTKHGHTPPAELVKAVKETAPETPPNPTRKSRRPALVEHHN
jgi:hypothetical protein